MNVTMFVYFGLLFVWAGDSISFVRSELTSLPCINLQSKPLGRIVGGTNTAPGETPYIVSLTRRGGHFCGATVLNDRWLLTAGHCVCNGLNKIMKPTQIKAVLGLHKISAYKNNDIDSDAFEVSIEAIIAHPRYKCEAPANDIALLELNQPIKFNENIKAACIALGNTAQSVAEAKEISYSGEMATVSGWGWTDEDQAAGDPADILQKATVKVWTNEDCVKSYEKNAKGIAISQGQLCAGHVAGGIDSCWADSGGPLITGDNVLIGVVSTGVGCARPGLPGIYSRVSEYAEWIQEIVQSTG